MKNHSCCFIGHRTINETAELRMRLRETIEDLIIAKGVDTFYLGSKSRFNSLCCEVFSGIKEKHSNIKRIYVRAEHENMGEDYKEYLLKSYEDTYYPESIKGAGKLAYVERNFHMIRKSDYCVIYYDEKSAPENRKSGSKMALAYADNQNKRIIKLP